MATVTGYTAARMKEIEDSTVVNGSVVDDHLILLARDGTEIDAGSLPPGPQGLPGDVSEAPEDGISYARKDGDWEALPSGFVPSGSITAYAGTVAPAGYFLCDGQAISRTTYADLFAVLGTAYGVGDGSTTFNVPNLKGRVIVAADSTQTEFDTLGETGGAKTVTLNESQMPSHTHSFTGVFNPTNTGATLAFTANLEAEESTFNTVTNSKGSSAAHENMPPYFVLHYLIKT